MALGILVREINERLVAIVAVSIAALAVGVLVGTALGQRSAEDVPSEHQRRLQACQRIEDEATRVVCINPKLLLEE